MAKYSTSEIIESSLRNVNSLNEELNRIAEIREGLNSTIEESRNLISRFTEFTNDINNVNDVYTDKIYNLLKEQIILFQEKIIDLNNRIHRIDSIDFSRKFDESSRYFFNQINENVEDVLQSFGAVKLDFEAIKEGLEVSVDKIQKIDLEAHFAKHNQTLSEIFNAVNNINSNLLNISNAINSLNDKINQVDNKLNNLDRQVSNKFDEFTTRFNNQDLEIKALKEELLTQSNITNEKLHRLEKQEKSNFIILLLMVILLLIVSIVFYYMK